MRSGDSRRRPRRSHWPRRPAGPALGAILILALFPGAPQAPATHACRFWALIGSAYPEGLIVDHLRDGAIANLRDLGGMNRDGWGFASFLDRTSGPILDGPLVRRGGPPANHPSDPDFDRAVAEIDRLRPRAVIGHVRAGTSGHWGIPNPHPFQHEGRVFAHNGGVPEDLLVNLLTRGDPSYLEVHPPDYVNGYIDSELYFLYLLKFIHENPKLRRIEALRRGVRALAAQAGSNRLNFVLTAGDTLYALRLAPYDAADPVRYFPETARGTPVSPYWVVASQILGSEETGWGTIPPRTLAVFVPSQPPQFLSIDGEEAPESGPAPGTIGPARPNPTRGTVSFALRIPQGGALIRAQVWNALGRVVWTDGPHPLDAGDRTVSWDGRDTNGSLVPSGSYYCRILVGEVTSEQTIAVVR